MPKGNWPCAGIDREGNSFGAEPGDSSVFIETSQCHGCWSGGNGCAAFGGQLGVAAPPYSIVLALILSCPLHSLHSVSRIFSELNSTEMHLIIVRGMNLPAPPGNPGHLTEGCPCPCTSLHPGTKLWLCFLA